MKLHWTVADRLLLTLGWAARLLSVAAVGMVLLIYVGEGFNPMRLTMRESILMVLFWSAMLGLVVAWRWEVIGGAMNVGGLLLFHVVHWLYTGGLPGGWAFSALALPGLLFLSHAAWKKGWNRQQSICEEELS
jgi:hypothetical protein